MGLDARREVTGWRERAACRKMEPELFFPPERQQDAATKKRIRIAKSACAICPVRMDCLIFSLRTGERHGIWGGLMTKERALSAYCQQLRRELERESYGDAGAAGWRAPPPPRW
jgi:WhiB family transcriptional regulator, redox-sensing transcriptional regulator